MDRPVVPISDPRHLARLRRASTLQILCLIAAGIVNFAAYRHILPSETRVYYPSVFTMLACGIGWFTIRSFRLPPRAVAHLPQPHRSILHITVALTFVSPMIAISSHPIFPATAYAAMFGAPITIIGLTVLLGGLLSAQPGPPACPKCRYPMAGLPLPTPCPECARPLTETDRQSFTPVSRIDAKAAYTGGLTACIGLTLTFLILGATDTLYRALPGPIHRLLAASEVPAFQTLDTSALTPDQRATLAERIIDERARRKDPYDLIPQVNWLRAELVSGWLGEEKSQRLISDGLSLSLHASGQRTLQLGHPSTIGLQVNAVYPMVIPDLYFIITSLQVNQEQVPHPTTVFTMHEINPKIIRTPAPGATLRHGPQAVITPTTAEPLQVRATVLVFPIGTPSPEPVVSIHSNGTIEITPTPTFSVELSAATTFQVVP